jgi:hypothetical protein
VGCGSPNVAAVFVSGGSGDGVGLSLNLTVSSVSDRPRLGKSAGSAAAAGAASCAEAAAALGDAGSGVDAVGVWDRPADGAVGARLAGGVGVRGRPVAGATGVYVRPAAGGGNVAAGARVRPGSDWVRDRVAAGVLVPASSAAAPEYAVGDAVLARDANGDVSVRPSARGGVALRGMLDTAGLLGPVVVREAPRSRGDGVAVRATPGCVVVVRAEITHAVHDTRA